MSVQKFKEIFDGLQEAYGTFKIGGGARITDHDALGEPSEG